MSELQPDDYRGLPLGSCQGQSFVPWDARGFLSVEVLQILKGKIWDVVALGYVHSLRPSILRVVRGGIQLDARPWRVTVWLDEDDKTIRKIEQEVEVGLPPGVPHGDGLRMALKYGLDSEEVKWHNIDGDYIYDNTGESLRAYKSTPDGKMIPFPGQKD